MHCDCYVLFIRLDGTEKPIFDREDYFVKQRDLYDTSLYHGELMMVGYEEGNPEADILFTEDRDELLARALAFTKAKLEKILSLISKVS